MKNKKLNLRELKVKSFVTDVESERSETVKGGSWVHCGVPISAGGYNCVPSNSYIAACEALSINYCDTFNQIQ